MDNLKLDKSLQELKDSVNQIGNSSIETFLAENYPEKWINLDEDKKQSIINEIREFRDSPNNKSKIRKVKEKLDYYRNIEFNIGILFLGVLLGVAGNLVANLLDRYFVQYGYIYDFGVAAIFFISLWYIDREFVKKTEKEIYKDQITLGIRAILDRFENS